MITGIVNRRREARVRVSVAAPGGKPREIEALLDTGFNGSLTIPPGIVKELGLPWRTRSSFFLANGSEEQTEVYAAEILWDGENRRILVEATGRAPLVGMSLLNGYQVRIDVVNEGLVQVKELPNRET